MLTNTVFSFINAVYIGGDPLAQQENLNPSKVRTLGAGSDNTTVIEAAETKFSSLTFYSKMNFPKKRRKQTNSNNNYTTREQHNIKQKHDSVVTNLPGVARTTSLISPQLSSDKNTIFKMISKIVFTLFAIMTSTLQICKITPLNKLKMMKPTARFRTS